MNESLGKFLFIAGIIIAAAGLLFIYRDSIPLIRHLGKLPGDIYIKKEGFSFYFPIVTCILLSALVSFVFYLVNRLK